MHIHNKTQKDVGDALGFTAARISQMLKIPDPKNDKGKRIDPDPFSYEDLLELFKLFDVDDEEILRIMKL